MLSGSQMVVKSLKAMDHRGLRIGPNVILDSNAPETSLFSARVDELRKYLANGLVTTENIPTGPDEAKVFKDWPKHAHRIK